VPALRRGPAPPAGRRIVLVLAPTNLGLGPPAPGREPGTWRAPQALLDAGLGLALGAVAQTGLPRPSYGAGAEPGTDVRNGHAIRAFGLALADRVAACRARGGWPVVVGGDCSLLMGVLAGCRREGPVALVHLDGHSDFRHPGNTSSEAAPHAAAGMDLALATGRGEALLTDWPGAPAPLAPDAAVVQVGDREARDPAFAWPDVLSTAIRRLDAFAARALDGAALVARVRDLQAQGPAWPFWIHLDLDVLDRASLSAVDSPGSPGLAPAALVRLLAALSGSPDALGLSVACFDPDLDPYGRQARRVVGWLAEALTGAHVRSA